MELFLFVIALVGWWVGSNVLKSYRAIKEQEKRDKKIAGTKWLLEYEKYLRKMGKSEDYVNKELKEQAKEWGIRL